MPRKYEERTCTVLYEKHRFGDSEPFTVILDCVDDEGNEVTLKGPTEDNHPQQHLTYRFYGNESVYKNQRTFQKETQFHFRTFVRATPHSREGIIKYLSGAPNIGMTLARRLWDQFKGDAVRMLREHPDVAASSCERLSEAAAIEAAEWLEQEKALEDCTIDLVDLLAGQGLPKQLTKLAVKEWGNQAAAMIRQDPYRMMRFRGVGFKRCDALYLELKHPAHRMKRQALCAWYHVASNTDGDTWFFEKMVEYGLAGAIAGAKLRTKAAIELASRAGILATQRTDGLHGDPAWDGDVRWMAEGAKARNERRLAGYICEALGEEVVA